MKRSEINRWIEETIEFFREMKFNLPPFAFFSIDDWKKNLSNAREIFDLGLGWDLTDFGSNDFLKEGLTLFTLRNGEPNSKRYPKPYAEKIMMVRPGQVTPYHYHWNKMEDIINRGGGELVFHLYNADENDDFADTPIKIVKDGMEKIVKPGEKIVLYPGESITLPQKLYHEFFAEKGNVLVGEVSMVNDDNTDNRFYRELPRFSEIEEDEEPRYLLCNEYKKFLPI